ncbi:MAG: hypothetical protein JRG84_09690 [Deltaproteobacteria bacterium]|nr:hypothetical protein [Deltaproteobacteria bacterium]
MSDSWALGLLMFAIPAAGWALLCLLRCRITSVPLGWALAVAAGFAAIALSSYLPFVATGRVTFWPALAVVAGGAVWTLGSAIGSWRRSAALLRNPFWVGLAVLGVVLVFCARTAPFWGYDAKAIYGIKAKALLHERNLEGPIFQDSDVIHYHADYPLGLPLIMAFSGWVTAGDPEDPTGAEPALTIAGWLRRHGSVSAYSSVACLWILGLLGFVVHWAREWTSGRVPIIALSAIALPIAVVFPWVGGRSWSLEGADMPLALTLGACAFLLLENLRTANRGALVAGVGLAAAAMLLKSEASIALGTLLAAAALCHGPRKLWRPALAVVLGAGLAGLVAASLAATTAGAPFDEHYVAALADMDMARLTQRVPLLLQSTRSVLEKREMLPYWVFVLCVAVPWCLRFGGTTRVWALWVLGHLFATLAVFLVTPNSVTWHVTTALPRLWCHVAVPASAIVVCTVASAWSQLVRVAEPPARPS